MAHLLRLSVELQLMVGSYLPDQMNYYNLSLVCRSLRPIGEQLLYSYPELDIRCGQSLLLARTILSNPKIGKLTKSLLDLSVQEISGRLDKYEHDPAGRRHHEELVEQGYDTPEDDLNDRSNWLDVPWPWGWALTDEVAATVQEVQILTEKFLENLMVCEDSPWRKIVHTDLQRRWRSPPGRNAKPDKTRNLHFIKCLQSLKWFQTSGAVPWSLIPHLRSLKDIVLSLKFGDSVEVGAQLGTSVPLLLESVTHLTLYLDVTIFLPQSNSKLVYVRNFLACYPNMEIIDVIFGDIEEHLEEKLEDSVPENENWWLILKALYPAKDSLRQLKISFSNVSSRTGEINSEVEDPLNYLYNLECLDSLFEFTKLDYLSAPHGALTDEAVGIGKISLPDSLTTLKIDRILVHRRHPSWPAFARSILDSLDGDKILALTSLTLEGNILGGEKDWEEGSTRIKHKINMAGVLLEWYFEGGNLWWGYSA